jgi:molybdopterin-containing oxidoreductase family membrane subunit
MLTEKNFRYIILLAVLGLIIGTWGMGARLLYGHKYMDYGSFVPWGLWVAFDLFFLGLTAGAYIITILVYGFRVKLFAALGPLSVFALLVTLLCEGIIISLDLGHPFRIYRFLITPNFGSMLFWLVAFIIAMWAIYLPTLYLLLRQKFIEWSQDDQRGGHKIYRFLAGGRTTYSKEDRERDHRRVRILSFISMPVGLLFFGMHGAVFAILLNRPLWNGAMTPILFIMAALLSGGALITFLTYLFHPRDELVQPLGRIVLSLLAIFLFLEALQFFVGYQSKVPNFVTSLNLIAFGPFWWAFWILHLLIGGAIPIYILITRPKDSRAVAWACFLVLITFFAVRLNYLIPDLAVYKLEGLQNTFFHQRLRTSYVPNFNEWLVSIWIVSLGILTFFLGMRWLPVEAAGKGEEEHV